MKQSQELEVNEHYAKFIVGEVYKLRLSSYADKYQTFECTNRKENKVKGSVNGKKEKWYDIELLKKLRNGKLCEIETEGFEPDKRVSNYFKAINKY